MCQPVFNWAKIRMKLYNRKDHHPPIAVILYIYQIKSREIVFLCKFNKFYIITNESNFIRHQNGSHVVTFNFSNQE